MKSTERFSATVADYVRFRPSYPEALLDWLVDVAPGRRVVDLGCGTGIFARQLIGVGFDVTGVEPNRAMREAATGVVCVDGTAEATGLPDASADLVTGAQAFHWFDLDRALPEIARVLVPGGLAVALWNDRVGTGFAAAYDDVLTEHSEAYRVVPRPGPTIEALAARIPRGAEVSFDHVQVLDLAGVIGRAWSSSYVVHGVEDREAFDADLERAFHEHAVGRRVELAYRTRAFHWR
ncbi:MAG: methyltransferase domain-containing protein [Alphaproteobacteria bacterium]|nr:methyltransferase domain-containing protein [Alphaproteobacteria bacterium]